MFLFAFNPKVQLQERIVIYELHGSENSDMQYRVRDKINQKIDCTLLVVCTNHVVLCQVGFITGTYRSICITPGVHVCACVCLLFLGGRTYVFVCMCECCVVCV